MSTVKYTLTNKPTALSKGYDILIWIDDDGDIVCSSFSPKGFEVMKMMTGGFYTEDTTVIICVHPEEFVSMLPDKTRVGIVSRDHSTVTEMSKNMLQ